MPVYEYVCECGRRFEALRSIEERHSATCDCGVRAKLMLSTFSFKFYNPFTKDGEGFSSVAYEPDEHKHRVKTNMSKYDRS